MWEQFLDIYEKDETFIDFFAHDLENGAVWFDESEFARYHNINGKKILAIFTQNVKDKNIDFRVNSQNPDGVSKSSGVLFFRANDIRGVIKTDSQLRLDGELYTVADSRLIQDQIWRIVLEGNK